MNEVIVIFYLICGFPDTVAIIEPKQASYAQAPFSEEFIKKVKSYEGSRFIMIEEKLVSCDGETKF